MRAPLAQRPIACLTTSIVAAFSLAGCEGPSAEEAPSGTAAALETLAPVSALLPTEQACAPLETRPPNAPEQVPVFTGQTRACGVTSDVAHEVAVIASGLEFPWSVEPLPGGDFLVAERTGALRLVTAAGVVREPIAGLPAVDPDGQGGLLDLALSPRFAADRTLFWSFAEPRESGNGTSVARGVLSEDRETLSDVRVLFRSSPSYDGELHFGSRLAFGPDGMLYVTFGERSDASMRQYAQRLDSALGKIVRISPDGSAPADNPFAGRAEAAPEIWSTGHRNVQSAAFDASGRLWAVEHGTRGGDELNLIEPGSNYGWPVMAYGEEYSGDPIPEAVTALAEYEQPTYYWDPVIGPSGAQFYTGDLFPEWRGSLFVGSLRQRRLVRLILEDGRVVGEEHLLADREQRIRDVREGPDGALYVLTDDEAGELWRIGPE